MKKHDNPTGQMDKKRLEEVYRVMFKNSESNAFADLAFEAFDADKSGFIDFNEFLLAMAANLDSDLTKRLHFAFKIFDINKNATLDRNELIKVINALYDLKGFPKSSRIGENTAQNLATTIFAKFDKDNDKTLTEEEFVNGCISNPRIQVIFVNNAQRK